MNERQLQTRFKNLLSKKLNEEKIFFLLYKIPDFPGGTLRPFDSILYLQGKVFSIEFKVGKNKLTKHQEYYLTLIKKTKNRTMTINENTYKAVIDTLVRGARYSRDLNKRLYNEDPFVKKTLERLG